ncbi:hypothetical protein ANCCEY_15138, partial [Ancylostoma ceylanicum]
MEDYMSLLSEIKARKHSLTGGGGSDERESTKKAGTSAALDAEDSIEMPIITPLKELNIDTDLSISRACIELMPLCKRLMELGSDLVFSCADLVSGMVSTLDEEWRRRQLIGQIMIEEAIGTQPMVSTMLLLLGFVYDNFDVDYMQNGLLSPVVLWLDLYDKGMRAIKRRNILKAASPQLKWSYHAEEERISAGRSHKKWQPYSPMNQLQLNKAFFSGKTNCVLKIPRKEKDFTVDFSLMKQTDGLATNQAVFAELPDGAEIDIETLKKSVMEKSVRVVTNPVQSTPLSEYLGMSENKPKDWCETLNKLAPLSTRCPAIFVNTMEKSAKLDGALMVSTSSKPHFSPPTSNERTQQAVINAAVADAVRIPSPSNSRDTALSRAIDLSEILANNLLNDSNEMGEDQDDRSVQAYVRVSENYGRNDQPQENDHHRGEVMDEEMDEEAVEDSMSSGEEDNEDRTVEDEEGDDREEDDTMDGEDQDEEEEEDDEDGRREGE